jgi:hypothetical protein
MKIAIYIKRGCIVLTHPLCYIIWHISIIISLSLILFLHCDNGSMNNSSFMTNGKYVV